MNDFSPKKKDWSDQKIEKKLEDMADNPKQSKPVKQAAKRLLSFKRLLERIICWQD